MRGREKKEIILVLKRLELHVKRYIKRKKKFEKTFRLSHGQEVNYHGHKGKAS